jgi:hypothetical protein
VLAAETIAAAAINLLGQPFTFKLKAWRALLSHPILTTRAPLRGAFVSGHRDEQRDTAMNQDRMAGTARNMGGKVQEGFGRVGVATACLVAGDLGPHACPARVFNFAQTLRGGPV